MVWGVAWLSSPPVALVSSRLLRLLRLRLLSMEVMLEEEVVRERARRVIPADGTAKQNRERRVLAFNGKDSVKKNCWAFRCIGMQNDFQTQRRKENKKKLMADGGKKRKCQCLQLGIKHTKIFEINCTARKQRKQLKETEIKSHANIKNRHQRASLLQPILSGAFWGHFLTHRSVQTSPGGEEASRNQVARLGREQKDTTCLHSVCEPFKCPV